MSPADSGRLCGMLVALLLAATLTAIVQLVYWWMDDE